MSNPYRPDPIAFLAPGDEPDDRVAELPNVSRLFELIHEVPDFLSAWDGGRIPGKRYTSGSTTTLINNHFQGLQRLPNSSYMVVSGGDQYHSMGHLFVVKLASRPADTAWRSNVVEDGKPRAEDKIVGVYSPNDDNHGLGAEHWHVGGLCTCGNVLAAPVESFDGSSIIVFYDFSDPEQPRMLQREAWIERPTARAGAVAVTRLPNGHKLAGVLGLHNDDGRRYINFYLSKTTSWADGFDLADTFCTQDVFDKLDWQNVNFLQETSGKLYLLMTGNPKIIPGTGGKDTAHLVEVDLSPNDLNQVVPGACSVVSVRQVAVREFKRKIVGRTKKRYSDFQCHWAAGAGGYIHPKGALFIYSCFHWRDHDRLPFAEYRTDPQLFTPDVVTSPDEAWVDMFYHNHYGGRRIGLVGEEDIRIADIPMAAVHGIAFGRQVSSLRFQIPTGLSLRLYRKKDFEAGDKDLLLPGSGRLTEIPDLKRHDFGDRAISCRLVPTG